MENVKYLNSTSEPHKEIFLIKKKKKKKNPKKSDKEIVVSGLTWQNNMLLRFKIQIMRLQNLTRKKNLLNGY